MGKGISDFGHKLFRKGEKQMIVCVIHSYQLGIHLQYREMGQE